ncbi:DUF4432 family protein [Demequina sp. SYSU T00039]|uniref:DUF4432 family protein n=1 Tax=Demequina lignilytica TaxID=3051663 RepID=A0AAW7M4F1_9MICO|nr:MULTISPECIES: DUF4432 family protein [unclassified Demequina]MDN4477344.1 DUF4432 family protein [Demequina sp. SYSU T00039-1]MDN4487517.1 DUF4432 family protein [Demequina sp. SYSU T00039]
MSESSASSLLSEGFASRPDALAEIREQVGDPRSGPGARSYRVTMLGGVSVEILPERGLDLGSLWFDNVPYAWRSALGPRGGSRDPRGEGWIGRFGGGALATCGFDNIGPARDGFGLHGSHHLTPAEDVAVGRTPDGDVLVTGVIDSASVFGRQVEVRREIRVRAGAPRVEVRDTVVNRGVVPAAIPVLYHVNLGAPLVLPGTTVAVDAATHEPRDPEAAVVPWSVYPEPSDAVGESVWEHAGLVADAAGVARARVTSPTGRTATVEWRASEQPRCVQWIYPTRGGWALGIEPTNAPLFGPDRTGPHAGAPMLGPGEGTTMGVTIDLSR